MASENLPDLPLFVQPHHQMTLSPLCCCIPPPKVFPLCLTQKDKVLPLVLPFLSVHTCLNPLPLPSEPQPLTPGQLLFPLGGSAGGCLGSCRAFLDSLADSRHFFPLFHTCPQNLTTTPSVQYVGTVFTCLSPTCQQDPLGAGLFLVICVTPSA